MAYSINGITKVITLTAGTTSVSVRDIWSRWVDWFLTGDNSKYLPAFEFVGGNDIDASQGTYIPIYAFLMNGWKIKPQEASHSLTIRDGVLLVNGGGDPFNNTVGAYTVRINYQQPVQAISFSTEGGGVDYNDLADAVWSAAVRELTSNAAVNYNELADVVWNAPARELTEGTRDSAIDAITTVVQNIEKLTGNKVVKSGDIITIYQSDGITIWRRYDLSSGGRVQV